jgi:hypothetical protein
MIRSMAPLTVNLNAPNYLPLARGDQAVTATHSHLTDTHAFCLPSEYTQAGPCQSKPVVKTDQWSSVQVQGSLSMLHRAIDRAVALHDQRISHASAAAAANSTCGADSVEAKEPETDPALKELVAPASAMVDLVFL